MTDEPEQAGQDVDDEPRGTTAERRPIEELLADEPAGDTAERKPLSREVLDPSSASAAGAHAGPVASEEPSAPQPPGAHAAPVAPDDGLQPGFVKLHLQGNMLISMITPKVQIDGFPAPSQYGENVYPVAPGPHTVSAHAQWMWQYGKAQEQVAPGPGETAELWYAPPVMTFMSGAMGRTKQSHPGLMILLLLCGVAIAFVVGIVILSLGT